MDDYYTLRIFRGIPGQQYWEEFELKLQSGANVISSLMEIQKNPVNKQGKMTTPVAWEQGCLEEVCGSCSMLVNGHPRQACTALIIDYLKEGCRTITLAPFTKFPLIRDLCVDRTKMFEALKKVRAWVSVDGTWDTKQFGPKVGPEVQEALYVLSTCMTCGCCSESCPQYNEKTDFWGPRRSLRRGFSTRVPQAGLKNRNGCALCSMRMASQDAAMPKTASRCAPSASP